MFSYNIEWIRAKNRDEFLETINKIGSSGRRVVQLLSYGESTPAYEDDPDAFFAAEILIESLITVGS